ncbi:MAG: carbon starvation protein A [Cyclobacteriaceae bacterium]|nr:carbon starvation protein A [Cyclobacteriaceae bacterium]MCH8516332.1 carbon starvation protein A [Cyclobacteriaceae bacterium]
MIISLLFFSAAFLIIAYKWYGGYIMGILNPSDQRITPAHESEDGVDYIPTNRWIVLGHHFSSIAGAGPIVGPILAVSFGWTPAVLWILIGGVFFGAVHDAVSLFVSIRSDGKSIGHIIQLNIGEKGKKLFLIFSFATLILIIAVFADIIAKTFIANSGVASASALFIIIALIFGMLQKKFSAKKDAFIVLSVVGVFAMYVAAYVGYSIPINFSYPIWIALLLGYAYIASITPVNILLQPRDYLSSFLLYGLILFGVLGFVIGRPEVKMGFEVKLHAENLGYLFPVLFVTVACGAISGFHSLVATGTSSKQLNKESDVKVIGFGGMLIESFLAILAVAAVIILEKENYALQLSEDGPVTLFADGLGFVISQLHISELVAVAFVALTVSAFALTTLDTCTRLARFIIHEYFEKTNSNNASEAFARNLSWFNNRFLVTLIVVLLAAALLLTGEFASLWPIFGSANQLLAAVALLALSTWLTHQQKARNIVLIPMVFMYLVTTASLVLFIWSKIQLGEYVLALIAICLLVLAFALLIPASKKLFPSKNRV